MAPYLSDWQHGFVRGRSCVTQLVLSHHHWYKALDDELQVDVVFMDFAKAFDRVSNDILLQKLCNFGISDALLNWCKDYLTNREQRVVIAGKSSAWSGAHYPERATYLFSCNGVFTSKVIFRYPFPAKK